MPCIMLNRFKISPNKHNRWIYLTPIVENFDGSEELLETSYIISERDEAFRLSKCLVEAATRLD